MKNGRSCFLDDFISTFRRMCKSTLQRQEILLGLGVKEMDQVAAEGEVDLIAIGEATLVLAGQFRGGYAQHHIMAAGIDVQVDLAAHHLADVHAAGQTVGTGLRCERNVLGADTQGHGLGGDVPGLQLGLDLRRELHDGVHHLDGIRSAVCHQLALEEVHLGHSDKAGHKHVSGMVEHLLGRADLLKYRFCA